MNNQVAAGKIFVVHKKKIAEKPYYIITVQILQ